MSDKNRQKLKEYSQNKYYSMSQGDRQKNKECMKEYKKRKEKSSL